MAARVSRASREAQIDAAGDEEADEPGVVEERMQDRHERADPGERAAGERRHRRGDAPAAVDAVAAIEVRELERLVAQEKVVGKETPRVQAEPAQEADQHWKM